MIYTASGDTVADAWLDGCEQILAAPSKRLANLIVEVARPTIVQEVWFDRFNPKEVGAKDRLSVVPKVLFPARPRQNGQTRQEFYAEWITTLKRARQSRRLKSSWNSTYFERLVSLDESENQIERAINVLSNWNQRSTTAIVFHLSSPLSDAPRIMGSPCLQFCEILWHKNDMIDLVAVYRNHDYLNKALGNFIGLGRLLAFIANESGKQTGRLVCHSVHAYADQIAQLRRLVVR